MKRVIDVGTRGSPRSVTVASLDPTVYDHTDIRHPWIVTLALDSPRGHVAVNASREEVLAIVRAILEAAKVDPGELVDEAPPPVTSTPTPTKAAEPWIRRPGRPMGGKRTAP